MERFTISLDDYLANEFDALITQRGYNNRSEAVRDILRSYLDRQREESDQEGMCVANLSYIYSYRERSLTERLAHIQHDSHALTMATMHALLDHDHRLETVLLKGTVRQVRSYASKLSAERGVCHGSLSLVMLRTDKVNYHIPNGEHSEHGELHTHLIPSH